jgi:DNA polymerase
MKTENELGELIADVKEHLAYMSELGIETLNVELPQNVGQAIEQPVMDAAPPTIERFVPELSQPKPAPPRKPSGSRLSVLPSLAKMPQKPRSQAAPGSPDNVPTDTSSAATRAKEPGANMISALFAADAALPESTETIDDIHADIGNCTRCVLCEGRTQIVHSKGNLQSEIMFIGEAPGADEDAQGAPFVGRAGQLLTKIIEGIGIKREDVFIGNVNRCRPPGNRAPTLPEAETCKPFLLREIAIVRPKVIVVMGNTAPQNLLNTKTGITRLRGEFQDYYGVKVMPTFHPAYVLRDPRKKREVWEDMKKVRDHLRSVK